MTTHIDGLHHGSISATAVHLCIDMQLMFAEGTKWASRAVGQVLPQVSEICAIASSRTIFTRFLTPPHLDAAKRQWRRFYEESPSMLAENLKPEQLNLVPELRSFVPPARVVDRYVFSAFATPALAQSLGDLHADTAIFSGVESDVCLLATTLSAIDRGYRVIIVKDAVASSKSSGHRAVMEGVLPRFDQQVELVDAETLLRSWTPAKE
jgi:nicotinamidase-related amidase